MADTYQLPANLKRQPDHKAWEASDAARAKATLRDMGIKSLDPYDSELMVTVQLAPVTRFASKYTPRKVAKAAGEKFYISTRPCLAGHTSERWTSNGCCVTCQDSYRAAHIDKIRKASRDSHQRARDRAKQTEYSAQI